MVAKAVVSNRKLFLISLPVSASYEAYTKNKKAAMMLDRELVK